MRHSFVSEPEDYPKVRCIKCNMLATYKEVTALRDADAQCPGKPACSDCQYSEFKEQLECKRYPPQLTGPETTTPRFPIIYAHEWCGEFKRKEN